MNAPATHPFESRRGRVPSRPWPAAALAVLVVALLLVTLAPFDFTSRPLSEVLHGPHVECVPFSYPCRVHGSFCLVDRLANLLGFVPLGALAMPVLARVESLRRRVRWITAAALALALGIETAQLFLPSRFPSTADVLLNALGAWLGATRIAALERARGGRRHPPGRSRDVTPRVPARDDSRTRR